MEAHGTTGVGAGQWTQPLAIVALVGVLAGFGASLGTSGRFLADAAGAIAVGGILLGVARNRPTAARAWYLLACGIGFWVAGDVVWDTLAARGLDSGAYHHLADWLYLAGYPFLGAGLYELVRARSGGRDRSGLLDGAILAVAGVILVWSFLIVPQGATDGSLLDQILLAAYPLADGLLLAGIAWLALTPGRLCASVWLLGGALTLVFATDLLWDLAARFDITGVDAWLNPWYPVSYALIAAAALHPSVNAVSEPVPSEERVHSARLVFLGVALFTGPLVALAQNGSFGTRDVMLSACSLAVAGLVIGRFLGLVRENERAERRFRVLAENVPVGIYEVGHDLRITYANAEADRLFGREVDGKLATDLLDLVDPGDRRKMVAAADRVINGETAEIEFSLHATDGTVRWVRWSGTAVPADRPGSPTAFASTLDISDLKRARDALERQATHDALTGLPNRRKLADRLSEALTRLRRQSGSLAVMFIDLDRFKLVNDVLGHDAGDALLVEIAHRIEATVRESDTVARIGGDEFVVLCEQPGSRHDLVVLAKRIIEVVERPVALADGMRVGASIGIALAGSADDTDALLRDADAAMYRAKANGRGRYEFFEPTGTSTSADEVARREF